MALRREESKFIPHDPEKGAEHQRQADEVRGKSAEAKKRVISGIAGSVGPSQPIQPPKLTEGQMATRHVAARIQLQAGNPEGASETLASAGIGVQGKKTEKADPEKQKRYERADELLAKGDEMTSDELIEWGEIDDRPYDDVEEALRPVKAELDAEDEAAEYWDDKEEDD